MRIDCGAYFPFFSRFESAFKISGMMQVSILFITAILLDGGVANRFMLMACVPYWCAVAIIMVRRNGQATGVDRLILKWGYPMMMPLTAVVSAVVPMGILRHL